MNPRSPRDPHISTTRTPASASRASVPPHVSDSSSGCANTARTVLGLACGTIGLDDAAVYGDVFVDHASRSEARDGAVPHPATVEVEHARKLVGHLLQVAEHDSGDAVLHNFADGALVERCD